MNILVTGAKGFVGKNLCANLKNIRDGKDKTRPAVIIDNIFEYDIDSDLLSLDEYCKKFDYGYKDAPAPKILTATLGNDAGIIGAAALID